VRGVSIYSPLSPVICKSWNRIVSTQNPDMLMTFFFFLRPRIHTRSRNVISISINASITFNVEKEVEGVIPFLDVLVKGRNQKIETEVYRKRTDSGLYLQYDSNHPKTVKNGIINTMLHRAETHSSTTTT
jgi:hypothetical protein